MSRLCCRKYHMWHDVGSIFWNGIVTTSGSHCPCLIYPVCTWYALKQLKQIRQQLTGGMSCEYCIKYNKFGEWKDAYICESFGPTCEFAPMLEPNAYKLVFRSSAMVFLMLASWNVMNIYSSCRAMQRRRASFDTPGSKMQLFAQVLIGVSLGKCIQHED